MNNRAQRVFITGASSGIGAALAKYYAQQGAQLGLVARRKDSLEELAQQLPADVLCLAGDVGNADQMHQLAQQFLQRFGAPDIVIANAGISVGTLTQYAEDFASFEAVLRTNVLGAVATFQAFINEMLKCNTGRLVGIASVAGVRGLPGGGAYSASKAALVKYLESLRVELYDTGIKVVTISPGYVATPMTDVNKYSMPFILPADEAARRFAKAIERGCSHATIPWQMACVSKILGHLPNFVFDRLFAKAPHKARGLPL